MATKYITKLNRIPERFKADTLGLKGGITKLELVHKSKVPFVEETESFLKKYIPGVRFNNPNFVFTRRIDEDVHTPTFRIYDVEQKPRETLETGGMKAKEIEEKLKELDEKLLKIAGR
jgi:hypothetical protein